MKPTIENQEHYEQAKNDFINKYWNDFLFNKSDAIDIESFYTKVRNDFNNRLNLLQKSLPLGLLNNYIFNWTYNNNSKRLFKNDIEITKIFCTENNYDLHIIAIAKAEFEAIQIVFEKAFNTVREPDIINIEAFLKDIKTKENSFCKAMPIEFAVEHFNAFTETLSKNGKPFLTKEQFMFFIKRAFLNDCTIDKMTLNIGSREKSFVVKRFYELYTLAANHFENTSQCKDKYIRLLTNNFDNWNFDEIKNNFKSKTNRNW